MTGSEGQEVKGLTMGVAAEVRAGPLPVMKSAQHVWLPGGQRLVPAHCLLAVAAVWELRWGVAAAVMVRSTTAAEVLVHQAKEARLKVSAMSAAAGVSCRLAAGALSWMPRTWAEVGHWAFFGGWQLMGS